MKKPGINYTLTKGIYDIINYNEFTKQIPFWLGLVPYEIYVIPFMYLAILQVLWFDSPNDVQLHLLPHWFAYSLFGMLKGKTKIQRPGCEYTKELKGIDPSHCEGSNRYKSFPSGHTGIAFSLTTTIFMELNLSKTPYFFEIPITKKWAKQLIKGISGFICLMVPIHRISGGYHSLLDVTVGAILGIIIGVTSWLAMNYYKNKYHKICVDDSSNKFCDLYKQSNQGVEYRYWFKNWKFWGKTNSKGVNKIIGFGKIILSFVVLYLLYSFLTNDLPNLKSLKH